MQALAPEALEYFPSEHEVQLAELVAPVEAWYVPAEQLVQLVEPAET